MSDCKALLLANNGKDSNGKYLLRKGKSASDVILSVVFKGEVTNHTLFQGLSNNGCFIFNGMETTARTLSEVQQCALACSITTCFVGRSRCTTVCAGCNNHIVQCVLQRAITT